MSAVTDWLRRNGFSPPADEAYADIDKWWHWYMSDVKSFYNYTIFNGKQWVPCQRKTLGMARQACQDWADLLLNEKVKINCRDKAATDFIVGLLDTTNFWVRGNRCIESAFWAGLAAIVPYPMGVQADSNTGSIASVEKIGITYSVGEQVIPLAVSNGECTECAFASEASEGEKKYTRLQIFIRGSDGYYVCNSYLFDSTSGTLREIALDPGKPGGNMVPVWHTGLDIPPWAFIRPNIPNPKDLDSPFAPAVFAGAIDIIQGIDTIYDAYINDYIFGKTRIVASVEALRVNSEGEPFFDDRDVVFHAIAQGTTNEPYIQPIQPNIRAQEMQSGLNDNLAIFSIRCGFGERHYQYNGYANGAAATATQVISENSHMFRTLKKHEILLDASLKHLCRLLLSYGNLYLGQSFDTHQEIVIDFDDSIIEDKQAQNNDMRADVAAGILRPEIYLAKKYGVSEEEAREMMPLAADYA